MHFIYSVRKTSKIVAIVFFAIAATLSGCSSPSTPGNTSNEPGAGSSFSYTYTSVDTNGVTSAPSDSSYTVLSDTLTYGGKTNVLEVENQNGGISYFHVESNGDVSIYIDPNIFPIPLPINLSTNWFIIPLGTHTQQNITLFDSTISYPYNGQNVQVAIVVQTVANDLGAANVSAAGNSYSTEKGSIALTGLASAYGGFLQLGSFNQTTTIWYAKQLKYYVERQDKIVQSGLLSNSTTSDTYLLSSYSLKN